MALGQIIKVFYEGKRYSFSEEGWRDERNLVVSPKFQAFLNKKAIEQGHSPSIFPSFEIRGESEGPSPKVEAKKRKLSFKIFE